ncbi:hypothetical protein T439DRAFT_333987 [Meredithblackwellia eburnea MCA 4105]
MAGLGQGGSVLLFLSGLFVPYFTVETLQQQKTAFLIGLGCFHTLILAYMALYTTEARKGTIGWAESGRLKLQWRDTTCEVLTGMALATVCVTEIVILSAGFDLWKQWRQFVVTKLPKLLRALRLYKITRKCLPPAFQVLPLLPGGVYRVLLLLDVPDRRSFATVNFMILEWAGVRTENKGKMWIQVLPSLGVIVWLVMLVTFQMAVDLSGDVFDYYPDTLQSALHTRYPPLKYSNLLLIACVCWSTFGSGLAELRGGIQEWNGQNIQEI